MQRFIEGKLACDFPENWFVTKYDDWSFYRNQFNGCCNGNKAMDFLGYDPDSKYLWMVEIKDDRVYRRQKDAVISLWDEVAIKARDTLAGLLAAKVADHDNRSFAKKVMTVHKIRIVLHLEQLSFHSKLFPRSYNLSEIQQRLKQLVKPIDPHPRVVELNNMNAVPWTAELIH